MELSESKIKEFLIFSQKKIFLTFPEIEPHSFQPKLEKIKKTTLRTFAILQETETPKKFVIFQEELPKPQKPKFLIFLQSKVKEIFLKALKDNSFHLFYKLNQTILPVYKTSKAFSCVEYLFSL